MNAHDFWKEQLKHAHSLNALVDNHRFSIVQFFLAFHGVIITALLFRPLILKFFGIEQSTDAMPGWAPIGLATGIIFVGLLLFGTYFSQHLYMRVYKYWIAVLEYKLALSAGLSAPPSTRALDEHLGTFSWDKNPPSFVWEPTIVLTTLLFPVLSVGVSSAVALVLGADGCRVGLLAVGALMLFVPLSFWIWAVAGQRPGMPATRQRDSMPVLGDNLETHRWGNAADLAKQHMGWFLGHFMSASDGLLRTKAVEVKWGAHPRGEERGTWAKGENVNSISILLRGDFTITFDNRSYDLKSEGDFVIWGPGVTHTWRANEESVILTVRWPSLEPEGGG